MHGAAQQTAKLREEYSALAPDYDRRWASYLRASLSMTLDAVADLPAQRILDVGCGTGLLLDMLTQRTEQAELAGIDPVPAMLAVAQQRLGRRALLLEADAEKLPFEDAAFQLVTCTNALHYFQDADAALDEMRRVLAPSGSLVVTDWSRDYVWMQLLNRVLPWTRHAHVHTFSSAELEQALLEAGFEVVAGNRKKIDWFWGLMTMRATRR
ncbi:MAG: methyltransferase domain-containing protein [Gammaproteobacteria bacterium]|nr:MAG: methyltransferase domain-containing protein [Gammaproteobacteria bacterium]